MRLSALDMRGLLSHGLEPMAAHDERNGMPQNVTCTLPYTSRPIGE